MHRKRREPLAVDGEARVAVEVSQLQQVLRFQAATKLLGQVLSVRRAHLEAEEAVDVGKHGGS